MAVRHNVTSRCFCIHCSFWKGRVVAEWNWSGSVPDGRTRVRWTARPPSPTYNTPYGEPQNWRAALHCCRQQGKVLMKAEKARIPITDFIKVWCELCRSRIDAREERRDVGGKPYHPDCYSTLFAAAPKPIG